MEELQIYDIQSLHGVAQPTIVLLDFLGRHVKTHELSLNEKEFANDVWKQDNVEREASMIIPAPEPNGGVIIIGADGNIYHNGTMYHAIAPANLHERSVVAFAGVDPNESGYLLGDMAWHLFMLLLEKTDQMNGTSGVKDLKLELLGETTIAETMTNLVIGYVYIGSRLGDSQPIRLNAEADGVGIYVIVVDNFTNLEPILEMVVVDLERQGQGQLVSCSGGFKEGSLRFIRNGIEIHEVTSIYLPDIQGMFLKVGQDKVNNLVLCFVEESRVLTMTETEIAGCVADQQTFHTGNTEHGQIVQV